MSPDQIDLCGKCLRRPREEGYQWCAACRSYWREYRSRRYRTDPAFKERQRAANKRTADRLRSERIAAGQLTCNRCGNNGPKANVRRWGSGPEQRVLCANCRAAERASWSIPA